MRAILFATVILSGCVTYGEPIPPPVCPQIELRLLDDAGETVAVADWSTLCRCPAAVPVNVPLLNCARCRNPDGSTFQAPGGCWGP